MTTTGQQIEIPLSKKKLILMIAGSIMFVGIGFLFVINPEKYTSPIMQSPTVISIAGIVSIIFFGLCFLVILKKLGDNSPGLIISDKGIFDNTSWVSGGQILWSDIENIRVIKIHSQKLIMLQVTNPQEFIDKQTSRFKRKMMQLNYKMYGTPLSITSTGLKISSDKLLSTLTEKFKTAQR